jgi:hypothetical protein
MLTTVRNYARMKVLERLDNMKIGVFSFGQSNNGYNLIGSIYLAVSTMPAFVGRVFLAEACLHPLRAGIFGIRRVCYVLE